MQVGGELIPYWPRGREAGREEGMNGIPRGARAASSAGKDLPLSDLRPNGMLSAQAHDFPAAGQWDPEKDRGYCAATRLKSRSRIRF